MVASSGTWDPGSGSRDPAARPFSSAAGASATTSATRNPVKTLDFMATRLDGELAQQVVVRGRGPAEHRADRGRLSHAGRVPPSTAQTGEGGPAGPATSSQLRAW